MIITERVDLLSAAIQSTQAIYMCGWQNQKSSMAMAARLSKLHPCGNRACIGGHLALMPEWRAMGGGVHLYTGAPTIGPYSGADACLFWFTDMVYEEETSRKVKLLIVGTTYMFEENGKVTTLTLPKWDDWTHVEAVKALHILGYQQVLTLKEFYEALEAL